MRPSIQAESDRPVFSIVLPTYDRPEMLRRWITGVRRQSFSDFELIVIDDGLRASYDAMLAELEDRDQLALQVERLEHAVLLGEQRDLLHMENGDAPAASASRRTPWEETK